MKNLINNLPSVSFVTPTLNSGKILRKCLESVKNQDYPKNKIEIILVDGGSRDDTLKIAKKYNAKIIFENTKKPEAATAIGYNEAQKDLIVNFPSDNILPNNNWLKIMIEPFIKHKDIFAVQPLRYAYDKRDLLLNRYFALFGVNDPVPYYLNKRDRLSWAENKWELMGESKDMGNYYVAKFTTENLPTVGANGYIIKREIAQKVTKKPLEFFHIDSNIDLVKMGYNTFGIVKTSIFHETGETVLSYFKRRYRYMNIYFTDKNIRRYHIYTPKDRTKLLLFFIYSITFVKPTLDSIRGFLKIHDIAWFMHPFICFGTVLLYTYSIVKRKSYLSYLIRSLIRNI